MIHKKSQSGGMFWTIVGAIIALVSLLAYLGITRESVAGTGRSLDQIIDATGDYDSDGILNQFDLCDCKQGSDLNKGCPTDIDIENKDILKTETDRCIEEIKKAKNKIKKK